MKKKLTAAEKFSKFKPSKKMERDIERSIKTNQTISKLATKAALERSN